MIPKQLQNPKFSFYKNGIANTIPNENINISKFLTLLKQDTKLLQQIRATKDKEKRNKLKSKLDYVTFAGVVHSKIQLNKNNRSVRMVYIKK